MTFAGFQFGKFEFLYVLIGVFVVIILINAFKRKHFLAHSVALQSLLEQMKPSSLRLLPKIFMALGVICAGISLMEPLISFREAETRLEGLDLVLVVDLSSSMQEVLGGWQNRRNFAIASGQPAPTAAQTPPSETRMEAVRKALAEFIAKRKNDRLALVAFSENSYVISPLTSDHAYLEKYVQMLDPNILLGEGLTAIGEGIARAMDILRLSGNNVIRNKAIVLFTDGEQNFGRSPIEPLADSKLLGYRVYIIGVELAPEITRKANVQEMIQAAIATGGQYYDAKDKMGLNNASMSIDRLEKAVFVQRTFETNVPAYQPFVYASLALISFALLMYTVPYFAELT